MTLKRPIVHIAKPIFFIAGWNPKANLADRIRFPD
jgi:hypothetical protein